ncbi:hypothetical protein BBUWI9123_0161 [Borreliella burgdorferi WI91-23]|nr:hypothetical protein BBUWI9123_0161 [Borreliella burgdorferi WI91-23]
MFLNLFYFFNYTLYFVFNFINDIIYPGGQYFGIRIFCSWT